MSIHSSLRGADTLSGRRSVYKRVERINILMKAGRFDEAENSVYGLPKVRTKFKVAKKKAAEKETATPEAAPEGEAKKS